MVKSMSENIKKNIAESTRINYFDLQIYFLWVKSSKKIKKYYLKISVCIIVYYAVSATLKMSV